MIEGGMEKRKHAEYYRCDYLRSNCDKTNVLISLFESPNSVRFENVYVYSKSLQESKNLYLEFIYVYRQNRLIHVSQQ